MTRGSKMVRKADRRHKKESPSLADKEDVLEDVL